MSQEPQVAQKDAAIVCFEQRGTFIEIAKAVAMAAAIDIGVSLVTKAPLKLGRKTLARGMAYWAFYHLLWPAIKPTVTEGIDFGRGFLTKHG